MTAPEVAQQIKSMIAPRLNELGVSGFILTGYVTDGDGNVSRIVVGSGGKNPAYADGLRPMLHFAAQWEAGKL